MEAWLPTLLLLRDYEIPTLITVYRFQPLPIQYTSLTLLFVIPPSHSIYIDELISLPLAHLLPSSEDFLPSHTWFSHSPWNKGLC